MQDKLGRAGQSARPSAATRRCRPAFRRRSPSRASWRRRSAGWTQPWLSGTFPDIAGVKRDAVRSKNCANGIGALSYFFERYIGVLLRIEKMPVGVGLLSRPLEIVVAAIKRVAAIEIGHLVREADDDALRPGASGTSRHTYWPGFSVLRPEGVEHVDARLRGGVAGLPSGLRRFPAQRPA